MEKSVQGGGDTVASGLASLMALKAEDLERQRRRPVNTRGMTSVNGSTSNYFFFYC